MRSIEVKVNLCYNFWNVFEVYSCRLITFILYDFLFSDFLNLCYFGVIFSFFGSCRAGFGWVYVRPEIYFWGLLILTDSFHFVKFFFAYWNFDLLPLWGHVEPFWALMGYFWGSEKSSKTVLGSTHLVEQLSFSMLLSILTFDFDLNLG